MDALLLKIVFFLLAVGILVTVHEFGHFWVARRLGVKVLRFSIGFGRPLWKRVGRRDATEYVVAAIPLGGYVRMLDEREGEVDPAEAHRAFNRQSLAVRSAVVVAGPLFNFLFAILAFWVVLMLGETGMRPLVGAVDSAGPAYAAGFRGGEEILSVNGAATPTWALAVQEIATASVSGDAIRIAVKRPDGAPGQRVFAAESLGEMAEIDDLFGHLGLEPDRPVTPPLIGRVVPGKPAEQSGLRAGDLVLRAGGKDMPDWRDWVELLQSQPGEPVTMLVRRDGREVALTVTPESTVHDGRVIGRIGAEVRSDPERWQAYRVHHSLDPLAAFPAAVGRVFEYSVLTLKVIWRILTGQASIHNLSGPLTIADAAGKTASIGATYFIKFLAIVSISLGVLNLLPVPVLDGGHLLYFAIEAIRRRPLSEEFMIQGQKLGLVLLLGLMSLAFYVDFQRFFG